jgi:transposase-like protein
MVFDFQKPYGPAIEQQLRQDDQSLSEKDRRRLAAVQAITLGHGGIQSIAQVLGCDPHTVQEGMREWKQRPDDPAGKRVRKPGGGRKKTEGKHAALMQQVHDTMKDRTAGDPMREDGVWTEVTPQEISDSLHA